MKLMLTPEQGVKALEDIKLMIGDPEEAHSRADDILLAVLEQLGHSDVVAAWRAIEPKWYA